MLKTMNCKNQGFNGKGKEIIALRSLPGLFGVGSITHSVPVCDITTIANATFQLRACMFFNSRVMKNICIYFYTNSDTERYNDVYCGGYYVPFNLACNGKLYSDSFRFRTGFKLKDSGDAIDAAIKVALENLYTEYKDKIEYARNLVTLSKVM